MAAGKTHHLALREEGTLRKIVHWSLYLDRRRAQALRLEDRHPGRKRSEGLSQSEEH